MSCLMVWRGVIRRGRSELSRSRGEVEKMRSQLSEAMSQVHQSRCCQTYMFPKRILVVVYLSVDEDLGHAGNEHK